MKKIIYFSFLTFFINILCVSLHAYAPLGNSFGYNSIWKNDLWLHKDQLSPLKIGAHYEHGFSFKSFNQDSEKSNVLSLYSKTQSTIPMLMNPQGFELLSSLGMPIDNGKRGNLKVTGHFNDSNFAIFGSYAFNLKSIPGFFSLSCTLPFRRMEVKNIVWQDLTEESTFEDKAIRENVTTDLPKVVADLGELSLKEWKDEGVGDLSIISNWQHDFPQAKKNISNVRIQAHVGGVFPTSKKKNEDEAFSFPLGNDGAFGIPVGGQLEVTFNKKYIVGLDVECLKLYDTTHVRRLKTDINQTEFLLLCKGEARKKFGTTWKFNIYGGSKYILSGLSFNCIYQYVLHNYDKLYAHSNEFNHSIINSMESLKEWNLHNFIVKGTYDFFKNDPSFAIKPQLMAFAKFAFSGRRSIGGFSIGSQLTFNF